MVYIVFSCLVFLIFTYIYFRRSQKGIEDKFKSFSYDLMERNNKSFLDLAKIYFEKQNDLSTQGMDKRYKDIESILKPIEESLKNLDEKTKLIEKDRHASHAILSKQIDSLSLSL